MPIKFPIEVIKKEHNCINYLETGLYNANDKTISCRKALACNFNHVFSIELNEEYINIGKKIFNNYIKNNKLTLIYDNSKNLLKYLNLYKGHFKEKTIFFLDAHIGKGWSKDKEWPLFDELEAIKSLERNDNIILIDDLRIIFENMTMEDLQNKVLEINPKYKFKTLKGYVKNDVLFCYFGNSSI